MPLGAEASFSRFIDDLDAWWPADSPLRSIEAVLTIWEPPTRIGATWAPGSTVEVRFAEVDDDLTTVIVEHRHLDRHDPATRATITGETGWWRTLLAYAASTRPARSTPGT